MREYAISSAVTKIITELYGLVQVVVVLIFTPFVTVDLFDAVHAFMMNMEFVLLHVLDAVEDLLHRREYVEASITEVLN